MRKSIPHYFNWLLTLEFISAAFTFASPLLAPLLMLRGGMSPSGAAWVQCGAYLCTGLLQPWVGHLVDHGKFKQVLFYGGLSFAVGISIFLYSGDSLTLLILGVIGLLNGLNCIVTVHMRGAVGVVDEVDRPFASGRTYMVHNMGFCVASTLAYFFLKSYQDTLLYCDLVTTLGAAIGMYFLLRKEASFSKPQQSLLDSTGFPWRQVLRHWRLLLGVTLVWVCIFVHVSVTPLIFKKLGLEALELTSLILVTNTGLVILTTSKITRFVEKYSERRIALWMGLLYSAQAFVPFFTSTVGVVCVTLVWTLGEILSALLLNQVLYRVFSKEQSGLASGVMSSLRSLGLVLSPVLGLIVLPLSSPMFAVVLVLVIFTSVVLLFPDLRNLSLKCDASR